MENSNTPLLGALRQRVLYSGSRAIPLWSSRHPLDERVSASIARLSGGLHKNDAAASGHFAKSDQSSFAPKAERQSGPKVVKHGAPTEPSGIRPAYPRAKETAAGPETQVGCRLVVPRRKRPEDPRRRSKVSTDTRIRVRKLKFTCGGQPLPHPPAPLSILFPCPNLFALGDVNVA